MNPKKKIYVIINPKSGTSSKRNLPHRVAEALDANEFELHIFITGYAGHGYEIAKLAVERKVDYVIAVGGDGTVNEIARGLVHSDTALGIIPQGSGNGLGRDLNIPLELKKALEVILEQNVVEIDYGIANNEIFFCTCGVGFDAEVAKKAEGKKQRGSIMYLMNIMETFFTDKPKKYKIECPEGIIEDEAFVVTCANASQYGYNAHIAPHADIQDGLMNIAILKPLKLIDVPQASIQLFANKIDENKKMINLMTSEAIIYREEEGQMHIDGDPIHTSKDIHVKIIPNGLKVLVPTKVKKKNPLNPEEILLNIAKAIS